MNQTALDELCDQLFYVPPHVAGSIEDFEEALARNLEPLDRLPPVVKPDWGAVCLLASIVLAGIGLLLVRMK